LFIHLRLCLPSNLFSSGFPTDILYAFLSIRATCPARLILLYLIILIMSGVEYNTVYEAFHYAVFLQSPVTSSLFGSHILLSTLFSNIFSPCSALKAY
jgi:hypothetical protein